MSLGTTDAFVPKTACQQEESSQESYVILKRFLQQTPGPAAVTTGQLSGAMADHEGLVDRTVRCGAKESQWIAGNRVMKLQ